MAASSCQQNSTSKLGRLDLLHQKVVDLVPPYSQCYGAAIWYMNALNLQALTSTEGCPEGPREELTVRLNWLVGSQCSPAYREAKELPRTGAQLLLYRQNMTYAVTSHHICHLPGIQYDAFDVTSQATAIGRKLPTKIYWPVTAKLVAV